MHDAIVLEAKLISGVTVINLASSVFPGPAGGSSVGAAFVTRLTLFSLECGSSSAANSRCHCQCMLTCTVDQGTSTDPALLPSPLLLHCACFSLPGTMRVHQIERDILRATLSLPLEDNEL